MQLVKNQVSQTDMCVDERGELDRIVVSCGNRRRLNNDLRAPIMYSGFIDI